MALSLSVADFGAPADTLALAPLAEQLGYRRYWLGEHHGPHQSATPLLLAALVAGVTERMRVGSAGVCLPLHPPYRVAQEARLLELVYPGRIDLGVCRGMRLAAAVERALVDGEGQGFAARVRELDGLLRGQLPPEHPLHATPVGPLSDSLPEIWVLGLSAATAALAASVRGAFCFSAHHNPAGADAAEVLRGYAAACARDGVPARAALLVSCLCAESDAEAARLYALSDGGGPRLPPTVCGAPATCAQQLAELADRCGVDELVLLDYPHPEATLARRAWSLRAMATACAPATAG